MSDYTLLYAFGLGAYYSGSTIRGQLIDSFGVNSGSAITSGINEDGINEGWFRASIVIPADFRGWIRFYVNGAPTAPKMLFAINPEEAEYTNYSLAAIRAAITALGTIIPPLDSSHIQVYRGTTWLVPLTLGDITGYTDIWVTVKETVDDLDPDSVLQVQKTVGQTYWLGATATASNASITVIDVTSGAIVVMVKETITKNAAPVTGLVFDAKVRIGGQTLEKRAGTWDILPDVGRVIS